MGDTDSQGDPRGYTKQRHAWRDPDLRYEGWVEWGGELIWAVGFTSGGGPYGLRVCDFDPADLQAMGLDVAALEDAGLTSAESSMDESGDWLRDGDVPF